MIAYVQVIDQIQLLAEAVKNKLTAPQSQLNQ
jgi:hypothetical protein